jgi:hypothetical protein
MAKIDYLVDIDLTGNQLTNFIVQHIGSDPSAAEGGLFYHSGSNVLKFHNGTSWVSLSSASGDITGVTAGNGLTGGGTSGGVSLAVGAGNGITVNSGDVAVTAAQTTITSVLNTSLVVGRDADNQIKFATDNTMVFRVGAADGVTFKASGEIEATKFDGALEGNADTATALASAVNIGGVSFDGSGSINLPGVNTAGNQNTSGTAAVATTVTITDNESTDENNPLVFVAGGDVDGGNLGLETDGNAHYNPSTGKITATAFAGNLTGNVTGTASTATVATTVTITDNESTDEDNAIIFAAGGDVDGGNLGLESDGTLTYNPSTGIVTATGFAGALTGNVTGNASGSAGTVTSIGNLTGDVTSSNRTTTIAAGAVHHSMLAEDIISGQGALTSGLASTDELMISDAGTVKRMDVSVLQSYLQSALSFTTNTDADVSVANLKTRLAGGFGSNAVTIGDATDVVTIGNDLIVTGDLTVSGDTTTVNTATLSVEDPLIILASGNTGDAVDTGFYSKYVESTTTKYAGLFRDVSSDGNAFTFFDGLQAEPGTTVNTAGTGYDLADISAGIIKSADGFVGNLTGNVEGNVTGNTSGSAGTVTSIGNLTGDVTSSNRTTTIATAAVHHSMLHDDIISGQGALTSGLASTDEFMISDAGTVKKMDVSVLTAYLNSASILTNLANVSGNSGNAAIYDNSGTPAFKSGITKGEVQSLLNIEDGATADQSKSDIDGLAITTVGTLDTGNATAIVSAASTSAAGKVELATTAEALAGSDSARAVTPAGLAARSFKATIGDGSATAIAITHNLGTRDVTVQLYDASAYQTVYAQVVRTDANNVTVTFNTAPSSNDIIALIAKVD